ncbi:MAG: hypothetical protein K8M05_20225, partial [Deltaproteobacteria bacterium]|nr:hypothetical protein [Kofleriaceae bacterium]
MALPRVSLESAVFLADTASLHPGAGDGALAVVLGALASLLPIGELAFRIAVAGAVALAFAAATAMR